MSVKIKLLRYFVVSATLTIFSQCTTNIGFDVNESLDYCVGQAKKSLGNMNDYNAYPRSIESGREDWEMVAMDDWTSGFYPGILWYLFQFTGDEYFRLKADSFTQNLGPLALKKAENHDLGFIMYCSYGNKYRLTPDEKSKQVLLNAAKQLALLYNPKVGTILSWPSMVDTMNWPHNTIIDNMMNLELLFWAGKIGNDSSLIKLAVNHAKKTMENQFRDDYSIEHVVIYDTITGKKITGCTHQGYSDSSIWARGQAWAIYGFTMVYRETMELEFLKTAQRAADLYLKRLPDDMVPFWDFDAPNIPNEPKDASAAAITASALIELSGYVEEKKQKYYFNKAVEMLKVLSGKKYRSGNKNNAFLLHSTGHKPHHSEINVSINYADYYYLEALMRLYEKDYPIHQ